MRRETMNDRPAVCYETGLDEAFLMVIGETPVASG